MNNDEKGLLQLKKEIIVSAQRGYPILLSGAIYFFILGFLPFFLDMARVQLIWILGLGVIFPFGLLIAKLLKIEIMTKGNPLGNLGGIVAGMQMFYLPIFILVYQMIPEWIPFTIGILGGSHFLIYVWIYASKAYLFLTIATVAVSAVFGGGLVGQPFVYVAFAISAVYFITVGWLLQENKRGNRHV